MTRQEWGNPYTHEEHSRTCYARAEAPADNCDWCGQKPKRLYNYDGWRVGTLGHSRPAVYCNRQCHNAYHS